MKHMFSFC